MLVAVGDELLSGDHVNSNAAILGQELSAAGFSVVGHAVVGDDVPAIAFALRDAVTRSDAVIVCGGLGPTQDDLTREALAATAGVPLVRDAAIESALRDRFTARAAPEGRAVPELNFRQADVPQGALALPNTVGTAPGVLILIGDTPVYALPGVPRELAEMWRAEVLPDLRSRFPVRPAIAQRTIRTAGLWESAVAQAMAPEVERTGGNPRIAFLASGGETRVVLTATGADDASARALLEPSARYALDVLGEAAYEQPSLEAEICALLGRAGATVACAESLTAGMLTARLANVAGASAVVRGGIVAYATDLKSHLLGVSRLRLFDQGAVSAKTAAAMASGVAEECKSTYGVALTGVAGPAEQEGQPPGTVYAAVYGPAGVSTKLFTFAGQRAQIRILAVTSALAMLRLALLQDARTRRGPGRRGGA